MSNDKESRTRPKGFQARALIQNLDTLYGISGSLPQNLYATIHNSLQVELDNHHVRLLPRDENDLPPVTKADVENLISQLRKLKRKGKLTPAHLEKALSILEEKRQELDDTQQADRPRRRERERVVTRRRKIVKAAIGLSLSLTLPAGVIYGVQTIHEHNQQAQREYEQTHLLGEKPSAPSYTKWQVGLAPEGQYNPGPPMNTLGKEESIKIQHDNSSIDTGIEIRDYKRVDGSNTLQLIVPLEDPYDRIFGYNIGKKGREAYKKEEWLLPTDPYEHVLQLIDKDGKIIYIKISKSQPDPNTQESKYIITPVTPQVKQQY